MDHAVIQIEGEKNAFSIFSLLDLLLCYVFLIVLAF